MPFAPASQRQRPRALVPRLLWKRSRLANSKLRSASRRRRSPRSPKRAAGRASASIAVTEGYSLREVGKLLGISRAILYGLIEAGFVSPARGPRREYRLSFHDLIVLRAAQGLREAKLPPARILRSLRRLRAQLPDRVPLSGLHIEAVGDSVVVSEGQTQWQPDDGQYIFRFQVESPAGGLSFLSPSQPESSASDVHWFAQAWELETTDADHACAAYRRAIELNARHV